MRIVLRSLAAVLALLLLALLPTAPALAAKECARVVDGIDLQTATIPEMEAAMNGGTLTSADLVDAYLRRIAAFDTGGSLKLNSIRALAADAREQAAAADAARAAGDTRPLLGIPVLLKDNVSTADMPTTAGSVALEGAMPTRDATIVRKLRAAGAII